MRDYKILYFGWNLPMSFFRITREVSGLQERSGLQELDIASRQGTAAGVAYIHVRHTRSSMVREALGGET